MKYSNYYIFFIYLLIITITFYFNPFNLVSKYTDLYTFIIGLLGVILSSIAIYLKLNDKNNIYDFLLKLIFYIFFIFSFILFLFFIVYFLIFSNFSLNIFIQILNIFIIIGAFAFSYKFFGKFIEKHVSGYLLLEFLLNIIFYIPCIFIDLIDYIKYQLKITTKTVWLILIIEIIIILLRILLPYLYKLYKKYVNPLNYELIEEGPLYLNNEKTVGVFQNLNNLDSKKNYNFAISCKIWINPQPKSTSEAYNKKTILLNYGDVLKIYHFNNKILIYAATTNKVNSINNPNKLVKLYEDDNILYQRWNNIVINYYGGTLDIFINNKLVLSQINITPVFFANKIVCGSKNGINGGIKSLKFYNHPLSKNDIEYIYYT